MSTVIIMIVFLLVAFLGFVATRPDSFRLQRAVDIKAPPEKIYGYLADFHPEGWGKWSPWEGLDPDLKRSFSGPKSGEGSVYAWEGNKNVGSGRMEILETTAPSDLKIKLDFIAPFKASNITEFMVLPDGDLTRVIWVMSGPMPFISKLMSVFISMDKMVGKDFEKGLAQLKAVAEA
jgi:Polyketide cyclase / dehydrase and lipid transport